MQKIEVLPQTATLKHNETAKPKSKTKPWLFGLCGLIPMMGVGYFAYNQIVMVP